MSILLQKQDSVLATLPNSSLNEQSEQHQTCVQKEAQEITNSKLIIPLSNLSVKTRGSVTEPEMDDYENFLKLIEERKSQRPKYDRIHPFYEQMLDDSYQDLESAALDAQTILEMKQKNANHAVEAAVEKKKWFNDVCEFVKNDKEYIAMAKEIYDNSKEEAVRAVKRAAETKISTQNFLKLVEERENKRPKYDGVHPFYEKMLDDSYEHLKSAAHNAQKSAEIQQNCADHAIKTAAEKKEWFDNMCELVENYRNGIYNLGSFKD